MWYMHDAQKTHSIFFDRIGKNMAEAEATMSLQIKARNSIKAMAPSIHVENLDVLEALERSTSSTAKIRSTIDVAIFD